MSRRTILAARRQFVALWALIFLIGVVLATLILQSRPPIPGSSEPLSSITNDAVLNLSMVLMGTQAMYGIPVFIVRSKLRISMAIAVGLATSPFVYIGVYATLVAGIRSGSVSIDSRVIWPLPVGAGLVVLVGILIIVDKRLRRIERRRMASSEMIQL